MTVLTRARRRPRRGMLIRRWLAFPELTILVLVLTGLLLVAAGYSDLARWGELP